jgi:hypothetical protein
MPSSFFYHQPESRPVIPQINALSGPISFAQGENSSKIAARLAEHVRVPRFGMITFAERISK